eukprot:4605543-Amphidinium_carterae.1
MIKGPPNYGGWLSSWRVYKVAMILLSASLPGPLDEYSDLIRRLAEQFPSHWGLIARADEKMRSDWWERIRRDLEDKYARGCGDDFNIDRPW